MQVVVVRNGRERVSLGRDHGYRPDKAGVYRSLPARRVDLSLSALRLFVRAALVTEVVAWLALAAVVVNVRLF